MRSAAVCAVILVPLSAWVSMTRSGSVQDKKRVYLTNLRRIDVDDWFLGGALLGAALAAVPVRRPAVIGWKRFLGAVCIGSLAGQNVYVINHYREHLKALQLQREYEKQRSGGGVTKSPFQFPREPGR